MKRTFATATKVNRSITIDPTVYRQTTVKPPTSKKSILHADYVNYYTQHQTMLILQHNNLTQAQLLKVRSDLKAIGARLRVVRVGIFQHAVKVAAIQDITDVNSKSASAKAKQLAKKDPNSITQLLAGPICTITFDDPSPTTLKKTIAAITSNRQLLLVGGKFEERVLPFASLDQVSRLPSQITLQGQLLNLLGSPAAKLAQILSTPTAKLLNTLNSIE